MTLYHRNADGSIETWTMAIDGDSVVTTWGTVNGKMQTTRETGNVKQLFGRRTLLKKRKGWTEDRGGVRDRVEVTETDHPELFVQLPTSFAPAKPIKQIASADALRMSLDGLLGIQRKRDGERHFIVSDAKSGVRVYTSGKNDVTEKYTSLLTGVKLPPLTILDAEFAVTAPDVHLSDSFKWVSKITRSLPERGQQMIHEATALGFRVRLHVFDILWYRGKAVYQKPYLTRWELIGEALRVLSYPPYPPGICRMPFLGELLPDAILAVKEHTWEGLVLWRLDQGSEVRMDGVPKRINCWKMKIAKEDDVIAMGYELGKGRNSAVVGALKIAVLVDDDLVEMGSVGAGLTDEDREEALTWTYPCVVQIEYDSMSEKGFRFPTFIRHRPDKAVGDMHRENV